MFFSSKPSTTHERALSVTFSLQRDVNCWWIINDFPPLSLSLHKSSGLVSVSKFCLRALMMRMSIWRTISLLKCQDFSSSKKWESLTYRPCSTCQLLGQPNELLYMTPGQWDTRLPLSNVIWRNFFSFHSHAYAGRLPGLLQNQNRQSRVQQRKPTKSFQGN